MGHVDAEQKDLDQKIFYESPGQDLYEGNVVGTMVFTITDAPSS